MKSLKNERGFLLLNVVFLTLITSFAAMILINAAPRVRNPHSTLRLTALHLANEQLAYLEEKAASGEIPPTNYLGKKSDLITENFSDKIPIEFTITTNISKLELNLYLAAVTVRWQLRGEDFKLETERTIRFVPKS